MFHSIIECLTKIGLYINEIINDQSIYSHCKKEKNNIWKYICKITYSTIHNLCNLFNYR